MSLIDGTFFCCCQTKWGWDCHFFSFFFVVDLIFEYSLLVDEVIVIGLTFTIVYCLGWNPWVTLIEALILEMVLGNPSILPICMLDLSPIWLIHAFFNEFHDSLLWLTLERHLTFKNLPLLMLLKTWGPQMIRFCEHGHWWSFLLVTVLES